MAFNGNFSISQGSDVGAFTITDSSSGSDGALLGRKIYLYMADGTTLVPTGTTTAYIDWPLSDGSTKTLSVLSQDYALNITVVWDSSSPLPSPSTYTKAALYDFTGNSEEANYSFVQQLVAQPNIINDTNFFNKLSLSRLYIDSSSNATAFNDIYGAQFCLDQELYLIQTFND